MEARFTPMQRLLASMGVGILGALAFGTILQAQQEPAPAQTPTTQVPPAQQRLAQSSEKKSTDGTQRQTAHVWTGSPTGPGGSFEDPKRDEMLRLREVLDAMNIKRGSVVADIGAGGGWLTMHVSRRVGPTGTVYAQEILKKYTDFIEQRARREKATNVRTILGTTTDPKLPSNTMDAVLILNAYHEFEFPLVMLRRIQSGMKPGARLGFIERDTDQLRREAREAYAKTGKVKRRVTESRDKDPHTDDHRLALDVVEREAAQVGFKKVSHLELRDYHYLLVVEKPR